MSLGIGVTSQEQIVLVPLDTHCQVQIAAFKRGIKRYVRIRGLGMRLEDVLRDIFLRFADILDRLLDDVDLDVVPLAVSPLIAELFVELDRVYASHASVDNIVFAVSTDFFGNGLDKVVLVGERNGTGG